MKKVNKLAAFALGAIAMLTACTEPVPTSYTVTGLLPDSTMNGKEVIIRSTTSRDVIATTTVNGNKFVFEGVADTIKHCIAQVKGTRSFSQFILENGNIELDLTVNKYYTFKPSGTKNNDIFAEILEDSILNIAAPKSEGEQWFSKHNNDIIGILLLRTTFFDALAIDDKISIIENFGENLKNEKFVKDIYDRLKALKATAVGENFVDFQGTDAAGNPVKLSDYVGKGNYVLVDMWASWCGPCKREIPNLAEVHNLYKDKGVTVLGVFVWDDVKNLKPTMEAEKVTWAQIIDSEKCATELYGVDGIPAIMLIGPDGTILERGSSMRGENMKKTIEKYLQK
jgi:thiol-disulfide isomerase/thioredoxin